MVSKPQHTKQQYVNMHQLSLNHYDSKKISTFKNFVF